MSTSRGRFEDQGVLIAAGAGSIGGALSLAAAQEGASVILCGPPELESAGLQLLSDAQSAGIADRIVFVAADITSEEEVDRVFETAADQLPGLHLLITCADQTTELPEKSLVDTSLEEWNRALASELGVAFLFSRRAIEEFLIGGEGGRIVHVAPGSSQGASCQASRASARSALWSFTRSIAKEYGRRGITCNAIAVERDPAPIPARSSDEATQHQPHVTVEVEAVTEMVLFLASSEASFISGEVVHVEPFRRCREVSPNWR